MTCNPVRIGSIQVEAHLIAGVTFVRARALAEACGGLVYWDAKAKQAHVVPAMAPEWRSLKPLAMVAGTWRPEFQMFQARFDHIWAAALRRLVDPLLMVAILIHEGTGSFNTNPANADLYNGNGPDADWIADTARAVSHVAGKLTRYHQAVSAGFREAAATLGYEGTAIQFVNWPGPIYRHSPAWGCYAQHADWWMGVTALYEQLGGKIRLLSDFWAAAPAAVDARNLRCQAVTDRPDLCSDLSGKLPRPGVVTWVQ